MDLRLEMRYPQDARAAAAMLGTEEFHQRLGSATGALSATASVEQLPGGGFRTRLQRTLPPVVPDFVRSFVGDTLDVVEVNDWQPAAPDGSRTGTLEVAIAKAPVTMTGTASLVPDGTGSRHVVQAELKASVPFVGRKIEESAAGALRAAAQQQERTAASWSGPTG